MVKKTEQRFIKMKKQVEEANNKNDAEYERLKKKSGNGQLSRKERRQVKKWM